MTYIGPIFWNKNPVTLKHTSIPNIFKHNSKKKYLFLKTENSNSKFSLFICNFNKHPYLHLQILVFKNNSLLLKDRNANKSNYKHALYHSPNSKNVYQHLSTFIRLSIYFDLLKFTDFIPVNTRLIIINIALLNSYFARCFVIAHSLICNFQLLKGISFNTKCLLAWCY